MVAERHSHSLNTVITHRGDSSWYRPKHTDSLTVFRDRREITWPERGLDNVDRARRSSWLSEASLYQEICLEIYRVTLNLMPQPKIVAVVSEAHPIMPRYHLEPRSETEFGNWLSTKKFEYILYLFLLPTKFYARGSCDTFQLHETRGP